MSSKFDYESIVRHLELSASAFVNKTTERDRTYLDEIRLSACESSVLKFMDNFHWTSNFL